MRCVDGSASIEVEANSDYQDKDREVFDKAVDDSIAALRSNCGEQISAVDAARFLRKFPFQAQCGDQVPAADAVKLLEKFARANGGPIAISFRGPRDGRPERRTSDPVISIL